MNKIPQGFSTITPTLTVNGAAKAIELYKKAFGATEDYRMEEGGRIMHACLTLGSSKIFLSDAMPETGCGAPTSSSFYLYMDDVDSAFKQAARAGLKELFPVTDMFWGDRTGCIEDPFGNKWTIATHVRDVTPEEMEEGRRKFAHKAA